MCAFDILYRLETETCVCVCVCVCASMFVWGGSPMRGWRGGGWDGGCVRVSVYVLCEKIQVTLASP